MAVTHENLTDSKGNVVAENVEVETLDPVPFSPSDALAAAIQAGDVDTSLSLVEVKAKDKSGKITKVWRQSFTACAAKNKKGALALPLVNGDESLIYTLASEASNQRGSVGQSDKDGNKLVLGFQDIYVKLRNMSEGPEKAIAKIRKALDGLTPEQKAAALAELGLA